MQSIGLSYRPIRPHSFGAKSLSYRTVLARKALAIVSIRLNSFGAQALATVRYDRTALAGKALATVRLVRTALARQSHSYRQRYARTGMRHDKAIATVNDTFVRLWHDKAIATVNYTPARLGARQNPCFTDPLARLRMC